MARRVSVVVLADQVLEQRPGLLQLGKDRVAGIHGPTGGQNLESAYDQGGKNIGGKIGLYVPELEARSNQPGEAGDSRVIDLALLLLVVDKG